MPSPNDETQERFPEQEQVIREIETAITDIRGITRRLSPELSAIEDRLKRLEGVLEYLGKVKKGP